MSSKFNSAIAFRPTPQTCYPPIDPQSDPGFIPCLGARWSEFVHNTTKLTHDLFPPTGFIHWQPELANMADINLSTDQWDFSADMHSPEYTDLRVNLRCTHVSGAHAWLISAEGRATTPAGGDINWTTPWAPPLSVEQWEADGKVFLRLHGGTAGGDVNGWHWNLMDIDTVWSSLADQPRSRPPAPMIPLA